MKKKKSYCKKLKKEVGFDCEKNIFTPEGAKKAAGYAMMPPKQKKVSM